MVTRNCVALCAGAFGLATVLTNSLRSLEWLHPVSINIIGFACIGLAGVARIVGRGGAQKSAD